VPKSSIDGQRKVKAAQTSPTPESGARKKRGARSDSGKAKKTVTTTDIFGGLKETSIREKAAGDERKKNERKRTDRTPSGTIVF